MSLAYIYPKYPEGVGDPAHIQEKFRLSSNPSLAGERVLVTGGGIGVGRGIAIELAREGAHVAVQYYDERELAESTRDAINAAGGNMKIFQADFSNDASVESLARDVLASFGKIDILVNNAGITAMKPFLEVPRDFFRRIFSVNLEGMFFLTQTIASSMKYTGGGIIFNISSSCASSALNWHGVYGMAKAAMDAFTQSTALELSPHGIRVHGVRLGWCFGDKHLNNMGGASLAEAAAKIPAGFISDPSVVGRFITLLCHPSAKYCIGHTINFDGGTSLIQPNTGNFDDPPLGGDWVAATYMDERT